MAVFGITSVIRLDTVIFATDFSPASQNAGLYASAVSLRLKTKLIVAHGFTLMHAASEAEALTSKPSMQRRDLEHDLALTASILEAGQGAPEVMLLAGDPSLLVPQFAQSQHPSLLVLGTHGGGSVDRFVLGSTAEAMLRHTNGAALTIGPKVNILRAGALDIRRVLYATDCSPEAAHAAPAAVALAEAFGAELDVLNVAPAGQADGPQTVQMLQQHFYSSMQSYLPDKATLVAEPHTFVCVGNPAQRILQHVQERAIDLLVLGLRRNTHLGMQNNTSGAFRIVVAATCPVVTVATGSVSEAAAPTNEAPTETA